MPKKLGRYAVHMPNLQGAAFQKQRPEKTCELLINRQKKFAHLIVE